MENKKGINFFFGIIAIILGSVIYKQFDFENLKFENPSLAVVYIAVFLASIYFLIRDYMKRSK
jgi:hypothetical protein